MSRRFALCLALVAVGCADTGDYDAGPDEIGLVGLAGENGLREKIVNGRVERGFPAVGALEMNGGGLCTGTVIAERWVISAAHCFAGGFGGGNLVLGDSVFGGDVRRVRLQRAVVHPRYDAQSNANDIALVELAGPAGVDPVPVARNLDGVTGQTLKWVGFGITSGAGQDSGTKRSVDLTVTRLEATTIISNEAGRNACRGDSGGPAFRITNGAAEVAGVTSWGDQDCTELTVNTRVDAYLDFLEQTMNGDGAPAPGGREPQGRPQPQGGGLDCPGLLDCTGQCADEACVQACGARASQAAIDAYNALAMCAQQNNCGDWGCVEQRCGAQVAACVPGGGDPGQQRPQPQPDPGGQQPAPQGGGGRCGEMLGCAQGCGANRDCLRACAADAAPASVDAYNRLVGCAAQRGCQDMGCVEQVCGEELFACTGQAPRQQPPAGQDPRQQPPAGQQPPGGAPGGGLNCAEVFICFEQCGPQNPQCYNGCYQQGNGQARAQVEALDRCVLERGCQDMMCVEQACGAPLQACFGW